MDAEIDRVTSSEELREQRTAQGKRLHEVGPICYFEQANCGMLRLNVKIGHFEGLERDLPDCNRVKI